MARVYRLTAAARPVKIGAMGDIDALEVVVEGPTFRAVASGFARQVADKKAKQFHWSTPATAHSNPREQHLGHHCWVRSFWYYPTEK